jgi:glutathione peroxidase-family protein
MKVFILVALVATLLGRNASAYSPAPALPSSSNKWLDEKPVQWNQLKGKVVLLNVWTFACWNSYNSFEWIVSLQKKYPDLQIIGIHSPEFDYEKDRKKMRDVMAKYNINYPELLDDNHEYWKKLNNRYWPSFYIVDKHGNIRGEYFGETHIGDAQAKHIEELIGKLTAE